MPRGAPEKRGWGSANAHTRLGVCKGHEIRAWEGLGNSLGIRAGLLRCQGFWQCQVPRSGSRRLTLPSPLPAAAGATASSTSSVHAAILRGQRATRAPGRPQHPGTARCLSVPPARPSGGPSPARGAWPVHALPAGGGGAVAKRRRPQHGLRHRRGPIRSGGRGRRERPGGLRGCGGEVSGAHRGRGAGAHRGTRTAAPPARSSARVLPPSGGSGPLQTLGRGFESRRCPVVPGTEGRG